MYRNKKYLEFVSSLPCCMCGYEVGVVPHHLKGVGHMSGIGMKAPDWATIPLCSVCHSGIHSDSRKWYVQWEFIARTLGRAIDEGFFK